MARSMRLFLIRHGETVDNVAQLYAGSRNSELTNHGFQQATRLGVHFQAIGLSFTHIFSSHLQRAAKTASKIREAQLSHASQDGVVRAAPQVVQLPLLMEQDFGSMEGKKWNDRLPKSETTERKRPEMENKHPAKFVDVESKEAMACRADTFLIEHFLPLLDDASATLNLVTAIVSHGIFLSTLWKRLLIRLPPKSVSLSPELQANARPSLEHLGSWANTGYLELRMERLEKVQPSPIIEMVPSAAAKPSSLLAASNGVSNAELPPKTTTVVATATSSASEVLRSPVTPPQKRIAPRVIQGWTTTILTINGKDHLKGLKRTGGGLGSSAHDSLQRSIDTFFKRRKVE